LAVIFIWLSGAFFHGARFSNYTGWLTDPLHVKPSAQVVWPIFGQEILNGDMGAGFHGIQITSGVFHVWRAWGITNETQLLSLAIGALVMAGLTLSLFVFGYGFRGPGRINRLEGAVLLACYVGYTAYLITTILA